MSTLGDRMEDQWKGARVLEPGESRRKPIPIEELRRRAELNEARKAKQEKDAGSGLDEEG